MNDCYFEKKDWRMCKAEVRPQSLPIVSLVYHVKKPEIVDHSIADYENLSDGSFSAMLEETGQ